MTEPDFPRSIELPPVTPNGPSFDEYRWSLLVEDNKRLTEVLDGQQRIISSLKDLLDDHRITTGRKLDDQKGHIESLSARLEHVRDVLALHDSRLVELEDAGKPATKDRDDLNERIVAFLESHPDLKFTAISIDENLDATGRDLSDRLKTLVRNDRIRIHANDKRRPFYQALQQPTPAGDQPS